MSDEEHSDSVFYYPEYQEMAEESYSPWSHIDKVEARRDTGMKS